MLWLGNRIRTAREQEGLTQDKLADLLGVSRTAVARWENGDIEPKLKNLIALAKVLHVSTDYLLGLEEKNWVDRLEISELARKAIERILEADGKDENDQIARGVEIIRRVRKKHDKY